MVACGHGPVRRTDGPVPGARAIAGVPVLSTELATDFHFSLLCAIELLLAFSAIV